MIGLFLFIKRVLILPERILNHKLCLRFRWVNRQAKSRGAPDPRRGPDVARNPSHLSITYVKGMDSQRQQVYESY